MACAGLSEPDYKCQGAKPKPPIIPSCGLKTLIFLYLPCSGACSAAVLGCPKTLKSKYSCFMTTLVCRQLFPVTLQSISMLSTKAVSLWWSSLKWTHHESKHCISPRREFAILFFMFGYIIQEENSEMWFNHMVLPAKELKESCNFYCHGTKTHNVLPSPCHPGKGWPKLAPVLVCHSSGLAVPPSWDLRHSLGLLLSWSCHLKPAQTGKGTGQHQHCPGTRRAGGISAPLTHGTGLAPTTTSKIFPTGMKIYTEKT